MIKPKKAFQIISLMGAPSPTVICVSVKPSQPALLTTFEFCCQCPCGTQKSQCYQKTKRIDEFEKLNFYTKNFLEEKIQIWVHATWLFTDNA